jgi:hypothetical protein
MKESLKGLYSGIVASGVVATVGLVYAHDKDLKQAADVKAQEFQIENRKLNLEFEKLEIVKHQSNLPSIFDKPTKQHVLETPVSNHLDRLDSEAFKTTSVSSFDLNNVNEASILNLDLGGYMVNMPSQTFQLAGLAVCCFSTGILLSIVLILLNNYQTKFMDFKFMYKSKYFLKLYDWYKNYLSINNKLLILGMIICCGFLLFIGIYLLLIFN